jgi:uncharacterized YigZ family protein
MPQAGYRHTSETVIKKSRFITSVGRSDTEQQARVFIAEVRGQYPDARHHPTAFLLDDDGVQVARSSDDGEPPGTAGMPMLKSLMRSGLVNVTVVVSRYFGGIKLGAAGLTRAYGGCVTQGVAVVPRVRVHSWPVWRTHLDHSRAGRIEEELLTLGAHIVTKDYDASGVVLDFSWESDPSGVLARLGVQGPVVHTEALDTQEIPVRQGV